MSFKKLVLFKDRSGVLGSWVEDDSGYWVFETKEKGWLLTNQDMNHCLNELDIIKGELENE
jgi:hypothetical protein